MSSDFSSHDPEIIFHDIFLIAEGRNSHAPSLYDQ